MTETRTVTIAKARRQRLIADLIKSDTVQSQEELVERLASSGVHVAQATISRDLDELGAVKVKRAGVQCYAMPGEAISAELSQQRLRRVFSDWVETAEASGCLIVLRTPPGGTAPDRIRFDYDALTAGEGKGPSFQLRAGDVVVVE